jgi:hypothetical protein
VDSKQADFLRHLADAGDEANMWQAGEAMGLSRDDTETLATELMATGQLEFVNLSGKVRLTELGQGSLEPETGGGHSDNLALLIQDLEAADLKLEPRAAADLAADLAALKAQLGRSQPLASVVQACLTAVGAALQEAGGDQAQDLARRAQALSG